MRLARRAWAFAPTVVAWAATSEATEPAPRRADASVEVANDDTTYGRLDGDLGVVAGLGATFGPRDPRAAVNLRLRYLDTAGLFVAYEDGLSATSSDPRRVVAAGFELRPLFLTRWLTGRESSVARVDLFVDSLGLEVGAFFEQPTLGAFSSHPGLQASLGLELPVLPCASGPWIGLHGGARWSEATLAGAPPNDPAARALFLEVTIAYHAVVQTHLVDLRDTAPR